ncbi:MULTISPECIES: hypothetical protein [unclassified Natrinema]|uniref:hypothetical protein n=1 Tax=unclassified Natrinema TaxID=2622230 RepID=UPI00026D47A9|nr:MULTISPECIES: hypothetical protein [unclassified Natrinema]AFO58442.1 hypothetical protein NJ7G_3221 [Natrinema sp. J7-2]
MEFDNLLASFEDTAGQKEEIGLIFYYLETEEEESSIGKSDVKNTIKRTRSSISPSTVSTYFGRLKNSGWITSTENDGYRLTHTGEREVEARLDDAALDNPRDEEDLFIDISNLEKDDKYEKLVDDINASYQHRIYDATMVLTRKFFEDMAFEILKTHYASQDVQMFYDQENGRHYSFDDLLNNLKDGAPTLKRYSRDFDQSLVESVRDLKDDGNESAHSIRVDFTDEEVEDWSDDATRFAEILYDVLLGARIANEGTV